MKGLTILIVDDDAGHRMLLRRELRALAPEVEIPECGTLNELRLFLSRSGAALTLAFVDLDLAGESGLEALRMLRASPRAATTPLLTLSTSALPAEVSATKAAGAAEHLIKPGDSAGLRALVESQLKRYGIS